MSLERGSEKLVYKIPELCFVITGPDTLMCSSPVPGGNEGLVYEDWGNN